MFLLAIPMLGDHDQDAEESVSEWYLYWLIIIIPLLITKAALQIYYVNGKKYDKKQEEIEYKEWKLRRDAKDKWMILRNEYYIGEDLCQIIFEYSGEHFEDIGLMNDCKDLNCCLWIDTKYQSISATDI